MSKKFTKFLSVLLCVTIFSTMGIVAFAGGEAEKTITINNPYKDVVWEGEDAWTGYKGSLHTHSTYSDATVTLKEMVMEYYNQGFGFLGMADHSVTGVAWNEEPVKAALYYYQYLIGYTMEHLTDEEFKGVTEGTYPMADGSTRDFGLACVTGANELNGITLTKGHVVGYGLERGVGTGHAGLENGHREAVQFAEENGGYSVIAHPGDWIDTREGVNDPEFIDYFAKIFLDYDSCLGMEVFNETNNATPWDRNLWDNILMATLPYGRTVWGYSNSDAHELNKVDSSFSVFMMPENTAENVKETMYNGNFFAVTRKIHDNPVLGPAETIDVMNQNKSVPMATNVVVDGTTITMDVENADFVQWIANGKIVAKTEVNGTGTSTIDLSQVEGSEEFLYVRAEIFGEGGCAASQPFTIDDGEADLVYEKDESLAAKIEYLWYRFISCRFFILFQELYRAIV